MNTQTFFDDVKSRLDTARKRSRAAFKAYTATQRKALNVVSGHAQSLARTEVDAAKEVYATTKASFEKARRDGLRQVAGQPRAYLPNNRETLVSAYERTLKLLARTGSDLSKVLDKGYRNVLDKLAGKKPQARKTAAKRRSPAAKTAVKRKTAAKGGTRKTTAAKTAASRKSAAGGNAATSSRPA